MVGGARPPPLPPWKRESAAGAGLHDGCFSQSKERFFMLGIILLAVLFLLLLGALPTWPHSRSWGYYPSGGFGLVLVVVLVILLVR
jgi:asparagine N-glycosylation enzyme membrane subunit Stt3